MFFRVFVAAWIIVSSLSGKDSDLDLLSNGFQFYRWKKVKFEVEQSQYGNTYSDWVSIAFIDNNSYLMESKEQHIFVYRNLIKTYNLLNDQLVIDERLEGDKDIFSILNGELEGIELKNRKNINQMIKFDFVIKDFNLSGKITVSGENWKLINLQIIYDSENWISISEKSWDYLTGKYSFDEFGKEAKEIIDFRE